MIEMHISRLAFKHVYICGQFATRCHQESVSQQCVIFSYSPIMLQPLGEHSTNLRLASVLGHQSNTLDNNCGATITDSSARGASLPLCKRIEEGKTARDSIVVGKSKTVLVSPNH